jgi:hypothetical protein
VKHVSATLRCVGRDERGIPAIAVLPSRRCHRIRTVEAAAPLLKTEGGEVSHNIVMEGGVLVNTALEAICSRVFGQGS